MTTVYILLATLALPALAQTTAPLAQSRGDEKRASVVVVLTNGRLAQADLGPGLALDFSGPRPVLIVTTPAPAVIREARDKNVLAAAQATFVLPADFVPESLIVARNGLIQSDVGDQTGKQPDYSVSGTAVVFGPASTPGPGDTVILIYRRQ